MNERSHRALWWLRLSPLLCVLALSAAGIQPTRTLSGRDGLIAMAAAHALVLVTAYATLAVTVRKIREVPLKKRFAIAMRAGVIQLLLTLLLAVAVVLQSLLNRTPFLLWIAIGYVVVNQVQAVLIVRWMSTLGKE